MKKAVRTILNPFNTFFSLITSSMRYKLILSFFIISVLPILLVGSLMYRSASQLMVESATKSSSDLIMKKIGYFDEVFDEVNKMLSEATSSTDTIKCLKLNKQNIDLPESNQVLDRMSSKFEYMLQLKGDFIDSIMILPRKGYYPFFRGLRTIRYSEDFSRLELFQKTVNSKNLVLWSFDREPGSGGYYITASSSVIDGVTNEVIGVIVIYLDINKVGDIFTHEGMTEGEELFVIDSGDTIIYHSDYEKIGSKYTDSAVLSGLGGSTHSSFTQSVGGQNRIITYYTSANSGWRIINTVPYDNVVKDVRVISYLTLVISLSCLLYALVVSFLIYRNIYNPIRGLTLSMEKAGAGNLDTRILSKRKDEFGTLSDGFDSMIGRITALIENIKTEQRLKKESEIKALQSQITPHFLYNTLNCIKAMVRADRKDDSEKMITALTALLKISLSNTDKVVTILEELNYVKSYIEIMEYRYEKKVAVEYDIDNSLLRCGILKFILQPIVENCFIHAFHAPENDWRIQISLQPCGDDIAVTIRDNGAGIDLTETHPLENEDYFGSHSRVKFSSIGLGNIQDRIRLNYGEQYGITLSSEPGKGTSVQLILPHFTL